MCQPITEIEEQAQGGDCPALYRNWELLKRIGEDLERLASKVDVPLPGGEDSRSRQKRAQAVDDLMAKMKKQGQPASWQELAEGLYADRWLRDQIRFHPICRDTVDKHVRQCDLDDTRSQLYFVIIRNAAAWYAKGDIKDPKKNWQGWVREQFPTILNRCHKRNAPPPRQQPSEMANAPDDGPDPADLLIDHRELPPEQQVELKELLDRLPAAQRDVVRLLYLERKSKEETAKELGISEQLVDRRFRAARKSLQKLLSSQGSE